ncbi:MAG TPA: hypothetical protein VG889_10285 [Rhizomicrobium sp.]|nr:hypothetical protein [Rhizomicrobium sp.]
MANAKRTALEISNWDFVAAIAIFAFVLITYRLLNWTVGYPTGPDWQLPVFLAFGLSTIPFVLRLLLFLQRTGGSFDLGGVKIAFPSVAQAMPLTIRTNLADPTVSLYDSGRQQLEAVADVADKVSVVVVDLEAGQAWYATRLFAIAATSLQFDLNQHIVFLAARNGVASRYVGYASAAVVATAIMSARNLRNFDFTSAYLGAISTLLQTAPANSALPNPEPRGESRLSAPARFMTTLAQSMQAWEQNLLATDLWLGYEELTPLLRDRLKRNFIELSDDDTAKAQSALRNDGEYVALLENGDFKSLIPVAVVVQDIIAALLNQDERTNSKTS